MPRERQPCKADSGTLPTPLRKLLRKHGRAPRVLVTDKLSSYTAVNRGLGLNVEYCQYKGLTNRAEHSHPPTRVHEKVMCRVKSARHRPLFTSAHDQVSKLFRHGRYNTHAQHQREVHPRLRGLGKDKLRPDAGTPRHMSPLSSSTALSLAPHP
ncbi:DDE-type integrase/transposase/recombinase [Crenobacter oryzisoli]|uniref:DDE-type integrase/transposase/recombinase n=1 Tax=Crenobacter oryzisoli TaxID=3056844 RepID=UPI00338E00F8